MGNLAVEIVRFIGALSVYEIVFFMAIMSLVILVVTMIHFVRANRFEELSNEEDFTSELLNTLSADKNDLIEEFDVVENKENKSELPRAEDEPDFLLDLKAITENLENQNFDDLDVNRYEKEQEEKAIISYEELLQSTGSYKINYEEEKEDEGITVKKVDLENLTSIDDTIVAKTSNKTLVSYEKEEAFLQSLKELNKLLS